MAMRLFLLAFATLSITALQQATPPLIANGNFEGKSKCPQYPGDIRAATNWAGNEGTPDYFHRCANGTEPLLGAPHNFNGCLEPYSGDGYAGLVLFGYRAKQTLKQNHYMKEFIWTKLTQPLQKGAAYTVSCQLALADSSLLASDSIHFLLATSKPEYNTQQDVLAFSNPTIYAASLKHIKRQQWCAVSQTIVSSGPYRYLAIGLFRERYSRQQYKQEITRKLKPGVTRDYAYYYLDAIRLEPK